MPLRLRLTIVALVSAAVLLSGSGLRAQALPFLLFERYLDPLRIQAGIPGLSAVILQDDQVVWERGLGSPRPRSQPPSHARHALRHRRSDADHHGHAPSALR